MPDPASTQATLCATLVDEWAALGLRHAAVAPGSRSTPMALALAADDRIRVEVFLDERVAAFVALGVGRASGVPGVALCTSGTAATHFHAAVVEAHQARVPLLALTADRPPELRGIGAPQTIDQEHLYGAAVRRYEDPGVADEAGRAGWRDVARRCFESARDGPVHLNLPFREPLLGTTGPLPPGEPPFSRPRPPENGGLSLEKRGFRRPLVVTTEPVAVPEGVPVLADARAGVERGIHHADPLLRVDALRHELRPDLLVRIGLPPASRVVNEWLAATGAYEIADRPGIDPYRTVDAVGRVDLAALEPEPGWADRWLALDRAADAAIDEVLASHPHSEPATARRLLGSLPGGAHLVVASSMPVRDLEWYAVPRADVTVHANRGANGIDGTISTAVGVALASGAPTTVLLGDVAFLHDAGALVGLRARDLDLRVVVLDNDGGGIFSFLPQASVLPPERYEQLFGTPHGVRPEDVARAYGADAAVEVVRTDRAANRALHDELNAAGARAVSGR